MQRAIINAVILVLVFQLGWYMGKRHGIRLAATAFIEMMDKPDAEAKYTEM